MQHWKQILRWTRNKEPVVAMVVNYSCKCTYTKEVYADIIN